MFEWLLNEEENTGNVACCIRIDQFCMTASLGSLVLCLTDKKKMYEDILELKGICAFVVKKKSILATHVLSPWIIPIFVGLQGVLGR